MKEIEPPSMQNYGYTLTGETCPNCQTTLLRGPVACPDGKPGCCVLHIGFNCPSCHKQFA